MSTTHASRIRTRLLIISDTHGAKPKPELQDGPSTEDELREDESYRLQRCQSGYREPLAEADVLLHCGDLTKRSSVSEFRDTFSMLRAARAPLKLVIAGNHDLALDEEHWRENYRGFGSVSRSVKEIVRESKADGVHYLTEGVHHFDLENGARLKVYASPQTPSFGGWAFQYDNGHEFHIPPDMDVAMTHGPPEGILDYADMTASHAGCPDLMQAIVRAKPRIHCFGHIHEAWGMLDAHWSSDLNGLSVIDKQRSREIKAADLKPDTADDEETLNETRRKWINMSKQRGLLVDLATEERASATDKQTLFLNAAIMDIRYRPIHLPWLVDIDLPRSSTPSV